jgi:hypothetical protein
MTYHPQTSFLWPLGTHNSLTYPKTLASVWCLNQFWFQAYIIFVYLYRRHCACKLSFYICAERKMRGELRRNKLLVRVRTDPIGGQGGRAACPPPPKHGSLASLCIKESPSTLYIPYMWGWKTNQHISNEWIDADPENHISLEEVGEPDLDVVALINTGSKVCVFVPSFYLTKHQVVSSIKCEKKVSVYDYSLAFKFYKH